MTGDRVEYVRGPVYQISSPSIATTLLYMTRAKAVEKIDDLLRTHRNIEIRIEYEEDGKLIEGFDEDTQLVKCKEGA